MIQTILRKLGLADLGDGSLNKEADTRRRHQRYAPRDADVLIGNQQAALQNWSFGGVAFEAPEGLRVQPGQTVDCVMQFRFPHETVRISLRARVIRASRKSAAAAVDLDDDTRRQLSRVLDNQNTQDFLQSQVA